MKVLSLGTAMPFQIYAQATPNFHDELGNADRYLFDIGSGSAERLSAPQIPFDFMNEVFLGYLFASHMRDLPALWVGGPLKNETVPL